MLAGLFGPPHLGQMMFLTMRWGMMMNALQGWSMMAIMMTTMNDHNDDDDDDEWF